MTLLSVSRSLGVNIFKAGSFEEMTGEQFLVLVKASDYLYEQGKKSTTGHKSEEYGVRVINTNG